MKRIGLLSVLMLVLAGCQGAPQTWENFPILVGVSTSGSERLPCNDYASHTSYTGHPYFIVIPENNRIIRRHTGMDFCATEGTPVLAGTNGTIGQIVPDNPHRGGSVILRTGFRATAQPDPAGGTYIVHLGYVHIVPDPDLRVGQRVQAGDVIGTVQRAGLKEIGPRAHVHFMAATCSIISTCHTDPNRFWQNGPGNVTCFDPENRPPGNKIIAPIPC